MATQSFLTEEDMQTIGRAGETRTYKSKEVVVHQQSNCSKVYWIEEGVVQIDFDRLYGHDVLAYLGEGDIFGEISYLLGTDSSANVSATKDVRVLEIEADVLKGLFESNAGLAARFYKTLAHTLARRVRSLNRR